MKKSGSTSTAKSVSIRITAEQYRELQEMSEPYASINGLVQLAVANLIHDEGTWRKERARAACAKLKKN